MGRRLRRRSTEICGRRQLGCSRLSGGTVQFAPLASPAFTGTVASAGAININSGTTVLNANGTASFGSLISARADGNALCLDLYARAGDDFGAFRLLKSNGTETARIGWNSAGSLLLGGIAGATLVTITGAGVVQPGTDNAQTLGSASFRWAQLYAGTTTINTSDAEEKSNFRPPDEALLLAALDTGQSLYQWADAVELKGRANARWHFGPTAQAFAAACRARGVDPTKFAIYCEDAVLAPMRRTRIVETEAGQVEQEREVLEPTGRTAYGLRLDQFDRLLQEARWRVLTGKLVHRPPEA
jgi:hypothetical protein